MAIDLNNNMPYTNFIGFVDMTLIYRELSRESRGSPPGLPGLTMVLPIHSPETACCRGHSSPAG